jgi:hypothetical protein
LEEKNLAAEQDADDAGTASDVAKAQLKAAVETLNLALAGPRQERTAAERQKPKSYQAKLKIAMQNLEDAALMVPSDGVIRNRMLQVGDMASPQRPVFTLALADPVLVRAYISEPDLGKIHEGMQAVVKTDSFPDKSYEGWLGYISPTAEFTPKTVQTSDVRTQLVYQVRIFVRNPKTNFGWACRRQSSFPLARNKPIKRRKLFPARRKTDEPRQAGRSFRTGTRKRSRPFRGRLEKKLQAGKKNGRCIGRRQLGGRQGQNHGAGGTGRRGKNHFDAPGGRAVYEQLSVQENLNFFSGAYNLTGKRRRRRIEWVMDQFGLSSIAESSRSKKAASKSSSRNVSSNWQRKLWIRKRNC